MLLNLGRRCPSVVRPARAAALVVAAVTAPAACGGDPVAPVSAADVVGTYELQMYREHALPWADTSAADPNSTGRIVYGGQLTLRADSVAVSVFRDGDRTASQTRVLVDSAGRWVLNPPGNNVAGASGTVLITSVYPGRSGPGISIPTPTQVYYNSFRVEAEARRLREFGGPSQLFGASVYAR